jgi:hypothetical protein
MSRKKMNRITIRVLFLAVTGAGPFGELSAQGPEMKPTQIDTSTECKTCKITLTRLATLGNFDDSLSIYGFPHVLKMSSKGLFYAIPRPSTSIGVYDLRGKLLRTIGQSGKGPGEFLAVSQVIVDAADTLVVVDEYSRRISIFDPSGRFVRAVPVRVEKTFGSTSVRLRDGSFVIGGTSFTSDRIGFPLHLVTPDGAQMRSFGAERPVYDPRNSSAGFRKVTASGNLVWATRIDRYRIEAWDASKGLMKQAFVSSPSWFPLRNTSPGIKWGEVRPFSWVKDIATDEAGRLWVVSVIARDDWKRTPGAKYDSARLREYYQTVVDVINPTTSRVVVRTFVPEYTHGFAAPGVLYSHRETSDGDIVYDVWRVALTKPVK